MRAESLCQHWGFRIHRLEKPVSYQKYVLVSLYSPSGRVLSEIVFEQIGSKLSITVFQVKAEKCLQNNGEHPTGNNNYYNVLRNDCVPDTMLRALHILSQLTS